MQQGAVILGDVQGAQGFREPSGVVSETSRGGHATTDCRWIREVRGENLINRHRAVADRLCQLVDDRHRARLRGLAGAIQDHLSALAGEERQDNGHLVAHVLLELLQRLVIEAKHGLVQAEDGVLGDGRWTELLIGNDHPQEFRDRVVRTGRGRLQHILNSPFGFRILEGRPSKPSSVSSGQRRDSLSVDPVEQVYRQASQQDDDDHEPAERIGSFRS